MGHSSTIDSTMLFLLDNLQMLLKVTAALLSGEQDEEGTGFYSLLRLFECCFLEGVTLLKGKYTHESCVLR